MKSGFRISIVWLAFLWAMFTATTLAQPGRPNVIVIVADDLGYANVGFNGSTDIPTPHLDTLTKAALQCTSGYVSHPFCSPTRAGLLTGRYQQRFGYENNPVYLPNDDKVGLPLNQTTIADVMHSAGYATGLAGKWHLGAHPVYHPLRRGFDEYFGLIGGGHQYFEHNLFWGNDPRSRQEYFIPLQRQMEPVEEREYLTDAIARESVAYIDRHKAHPFFLYLAFNAPHTPSQAKADLLERVKHIPEVKRRTYAAMVCGLDDGIGRVLAKLREHKLDHDTLIFFFSDNGGQINQATQSDNHPLRGVKGQMYEGGIRVPFLISWPKTLPRGRKYDQAVSSLDVFATAAAAAGAQLPKTKLDSVNLLPYLLGKKRGAPHERLFWQWRPGDERVSWAVREGRWKLVSPRAGVMELYDLRSGISETRDLAQMEPRRVARLKQSYERWKAQTINPLWSSPDVSRAPNAR